MPKTIKYKFFSTLVLLSLILAACGTESAPEPAQEVNDIQTAVAETITAQNANTPIPAASAVTQGPLVFSPTLTPLAPIATQTQTPAPASAKSGCASASLVSETFPDGTIFKPGSQFIKNWQIKNTSVCTWDTTYKIIFWNGDLLGGSYYYNLPQIVAPGQILPISLILTAPIQVATYRSEWMLQTPDSIEFGVGEYNVPFYTEIEVSSDAAPVYTVTNVDYNVVRDPATGCPANVNYTVYATVTTNGPLTLNYYWAQSDGNDSSPETIIIDKATTITLSHSWKLHIATNVGTRWMALVVISPVAKQYPHAEFVKTCGE
jgi:hypothetical protein